MHMTAPGERRQRHRPARSLVTIIVALALFGLAPLRVAASTKPIEIDRPEPTTAITSNHMHHDALSSSCGAYYYDTLSTNSHLETINGDPDWIRFQNFQVTFTMEGNSFVSSGDIWIANARSRLYTDGSYDHQGWTNATGFAVPIDSSSYTQDRAGFVMPYSYDSPASINVQLYPGGYPEDLNSYCASQDAQGYIPGYSYGAPFTDVPSNSVDYYPLYMLHKRGIVNGYPPNFNTAGPGDSINRAQVAAIIARANGWNNITQYGDSCFSDLDGVSQDLRYNICTLHAFGIANGYGDGTYGPFNPVLHVQAISLITRALVYRGTWAAQPDDGNVYSNVPSAHGDLSTFYYYAGGAPDTDPLYYWGSWDQYGTRGWVFRSLWLSIQADE